MMLLVTACKDDKVSKQADVALKYTCPMHPQIVQEKAGTCPICKMDLVAVSKKSNSSVSVMLSASQIQLANIRTIKVGTGSFNASKVLSGRLVTNPEQTVLISSRVAGRIEKLFVKETGRRVSKGEPIAQIFSEELQVLQQDYLLQIKQVAAFPGEKVYRSLRDAALNKLKLFGYSNPQILALEKNSRPLPTVTVYAGTSGVVNEIGVSEGQYISEGSTILRIENFNRLWVEADVYPSELSQASVGSLLKISINGFPQLSKSARVDFVSPALDPSTQRLTIRASVDNFSGLLQPGMQANVFLSSGKMTKAVSLPLEAVIRDESGSQVWVKSGKNSFTAHHVVTGAEDANQIIITSGISNGEEIVSSGAYLLHSEFILKRGASL